MFKPIAADHNFIQMEKKWLSHWYNNGIIDQYLKKNKTSKKYFSFLDGPITANNPMGVHHAWGRTYKDLWPKFFNLLGYKQRFQNGFDCQGLWVEVEVEKELGLKNKKEIENLIPGNKKESIAKFVQLCKDRVYRFSKIQTEQSKRLGYFADWDHSYYTMSDENNYMIWRFLKVCYENGWIYKGRESVPWCPRCQTAISQHEILTEDYKEVVHDAVYIKFKLIDKDEYLLVWTTTPWTIPANIAVAVDEELDYTLVKLDNQKYWVAKELVETIFADKKIQLLKEVKGKKLVGLKYEAPFDYLEAVKKVAKNTDLNKFHIVIPTDPKILPISLEEGTGLVHTAVSAGTEDFKLGKKLGLPMIPVIDDEANYLKGMGEFTGKNAKNDPWLILGFLKKNNWAYRIHQYKHRYPACWRCKTELVWKVADEWYIAMDKPAKIKGQKSKNKNYTLRERMIKVAKKIRWMPEFGLERELDWLKNMHDWLISKKNRYWGLSLPIYECSKCGFFEVIGSKEELKKRAVKGWQEFEGHSPHKPFIDEVKITCQKCGQLVSRIEDVGNPWLDAGIVPYSTISENNQGQPLYLKDKKEWQQWFPVDFITESFPGQFKNWFYALIAESTVLENEPPFKRVLGFGTLLGEDGRPMHKSWGNAIEFNEGADKIGVDVMRWMYSRQNPADNMLFGYKKADEVRRQFYLILWNVYRFFVDYINLDQIKVIQLNKKSFKKLSFQPLDLWLIAYFQRLVLTVEKSLKNFDAKTAALAIEEFVIELSTWYIRRSRDRVWVNSDSIKDKQAFYSTLYFVLVNLSIIISPFLPFISEEIYTNLTGNRSVHLAFWPKIDFEVDSQLIEKMTQLKKIIEVGRRERKSLKLKIRQPLAKAKIISNFLIDDNLLYLLKQELNVKKVKVELNKKLNEPKVVFETKLTLDLILEGELRELVRQIQQERKKLKLKPNQKIKLFIPKKFAKFEKILQKKLICRQINYENKIKVDL